MDEQSTHAGSKDPRIAAAAQEYFDLLDRGQAVDREEFLARYAEIVGRLRLVIAAEEELRRLSAAESATPAELAGDSTKSFSRHGLETLPPRAQADRAAGSSELAPDAQFGRYRIVRVLGRGAMGTVYLAVDTQLGRQVALKTPQFDVDPDSELLERLHREARAAAALRHPNICPIYDVSQIDGRHFISMAYIEGDLLSASIESNELWPERQVLTIIRKIAQALQDAHDLGILHRDLKPGNVMLDKRSEPIVMDFGLARQIGRHEDIRLTQSGIFVGTPAFMSPEQIEGHLDTIGPATDQYSLGVMLYELLTGQLPFKGSVMAVMAQVLTKEPAPPSQLRHGLDPRIDAVCLKMMAKMPSDRFSSLSVMADELDAILQHPDVKPIFKPALPGLSLPLTAEQAAAKQRRQSLAAQFLAKRSLSAEELVELEKSARRYFDLHEYEEVVVTIGRIPDDQRPARVQGLLADARGKTAEIAALVTAIDEAVRLNDGPTALCRAEELLTIRPGHPLACEVQTQFGGESALARLWKAKMPILWTAASIGLIVLAILTYATAVHLRPKSPDSATAVSAAEAAAAASQAQWDWASRGKLPVALTNSAGIILMVIPPGRFTMGSPPDDPDRSVEEAQVDVTLTNGLYLGAREVTQSEWERVMHTAPWKGYRDVKEGAEYPATYVDWSDAMAFCDEMTKLDRIAGKLPSGWKYTLPTEAQWEYACRAGTTTRFWFGDDATVLGNYGWSAENSFNVGERYPHEVGKKVANAWGLYDVHGNVWEWCRDSYVPKLPGGSDPEVTGVAGDRVMRGSAVNKPATDCRSGSRGYDTPSNRFARLGFRVACEIATVPSPSPVSPTAEKPKQ